MNYQPVVTGNQPNSSVSIQDNFNVGTGVKETASVQQYVLIPLWSNGSKDPQNIDADVAFDVKEPESKVHVSPSSSDKMILLVEKKYPLTRFTLEQMLNNVRLEVKEESKMSLELLSNQTIYNAPDAFVGSYTYSFTLANLRSYFVSCWLKSSWDHSLQDPVIFVGGKEIPFRNFMFIKDDEEMSFLLREPSHIFGGGSPSASINNEPPLLEVELLDNANLHQLIENTADWGGSLARKEMTVVGSGSANERMKNRMCRTKGSAKPPMKRKLEIFGSPPRTVHQKSLKAKVESSSYLTISDDEGLPDALELETDVDYHLMISSVTPLAWRGHLDNQSEFKLMDLHDCCYARQVVVDNDVNRRGRELLKMVDQMKGDCEVLRERAKVVSNVVPYVAVELVHSDEMAMFVGKLVSSAIFYGRHSYKKEYTKVENNMNVVVFSFLSEVTSYLSAAVDALLSKKPKSLHCPTPTKTIAPAPSAPSQQATLYFALTLKYVSPPLEA
nr:hypothetical protein [Tanacetum cinerariifolium]